MELKDIQSYRSLVACTLCPRIHSMELKALTIQVTISTNPLMKESIQWNWKGRVIFGRSHYLYDALRIHSMELKVYGFVGMLIAVTPIKLESIQWNWKPRAKAQAPPRLPPSPESIQWNWKIGEWCCWGVLWDLLRNPFNGIESKGRSWAVWKCSLQPRIHSMELKVR